MPSISINYDERVISSDSSGKLSIKISEYQDNGLSYDSNDEIIATKGLDGISGNGGTMNLPGNAIEGDMEKGINVVRCNKTVSRKNISSEDIPDCINTHELVINKILGRDEG